jgi:S-DNA-T family DNA segregation ATPase FtsK/SpoIIIE
VTTQPFVRPGDVVRPPQTGGGKIALEAPIVAPIPPPRSVWGIVLPITLVVGVVGLIVAMYVSGMRTFATGFGFFGFMAAFSMVGMVLRGRGAAQKMSWGELTKARREWFARQDDLRDEVNEQRRRQWEHRHHFHWAPEELANVAGSVRMWDRTPGSEAFAVVRVGVGKVALALTLEKPKVVQASHLEPATGHALRKFINEQEYIDNTPKAIWLQRFPGISIVGDLDESRALARAMLCQLAAFHSPADVQIIIVTSVPTQWEWAKWLPHLQHSSRRDGCGERRLMFASPAELEQFFDEEPDGQRDPWRPPASSELHGQSAAAQPLRVIIDDHSATPEDWAGLTGGSGYSATCFIRLAPEVPPHPPATFASKYWVGFDPSTTYRLAGGVLRKQVSPGDPAYYASASGGADELEDAFYAEADQVSLAAAERFARGLAKYRVTGATAVATREEVDARTLLDVLGVADPSKLDVDRLWAPRMIQGREWLRFPVGTFTDTGEVVELDLKEGSQQGMNMHSLFVGSTGAGKTEGIITEVASLCTTHSPEVVNIVFSDFKLKSAAGILQRFPHVVAAVSNLADERHLVGRMYEALDGELDRRGAAIAALDSCPDVTTYNQRRLTDPSLPPIPALFVICDEYNEMFTDPLWGLKFRQLFWRIVRQGRSLHVFLQLVGQVVDTTNLRDIRKQLGFTIAARTGREEDSREAIGSGVAAHIPPENAEGTAFLRVALREPRQYRFFYSSAPFVPVRADAGHVEPLRAGTWFEPRVFTVAEAADTDGRLAAPPSSAAPVAATEPLDSGPRPKIVDALIKSLQSTGVGPPRPFWLPPLGDPPSADDLVLRLRGKPWDVDYGDNPGLRLPVALEDRPREHRQDVHCLNLLDDNALIVCAPKRGATNAVMTMVTTGALMYRPERVQFYCIAASGPHLARVADLPHVAAVVAGSDSEGVARVIATVENIAAERDRIFTTRGLDIMTVREAKFGPHPQDIGVEGGDVVLVIDGWANFTENHDKHVETVISLMRARNYGVRVVITHTSTLSGVRSSIRNESAQRLEMKLVDPLDSQVPRDPRDPQRSPAKEVPDTPGRGLSPTGHHLMVGVPVLANEAEGPVEVREIGAVVRRVAGVDNAATVTRLPESVPIEEVVAAAASGPRRRDLMPFGLSERTLSTAYIDFAEHPHVIVTGRAGSGLTNFLRVMLHGIMRQYSPQEATIVLVDPRRKLVGIVPDAPWLSAYAYTPTHIREVAAELATVLQGRQPPPGATQQQMLTTKFWSGREFFVVVDDISSWSNAENPLAPLAPYVEQAAELGLHIIAGADIRNWSYLSMGSGVQGRIVGSLAPIVILDGRREHGQIVSGVYAEPQRPGKGMLATRNGIEGVLIGWSEPPTRPSAGVSPLSPLMAQQVAEAEAAAAARQVEALDRVVREERSAEEEARHIAELEARRNQPGSGSKWFE